MTKAYPHYYKDFHCIAERCRHNCCIGWEIDIDRVTYKKYRRTPEILKTTRRDRHGAHFCTDERGRCLQLDERGRCRIIERFGEEFLPDICRLHPRFINDRGSREETGLGLCCEEAARLIIKSEEPFSIIGDGDDEFCRFRRRALNASAKELPSLIGETWQTRPAAFWGGFSARSNG